MADPRQPGSADPSAPSGVVPSDVPADVPSDAPADAPASPPDADAPGVSTSPDEPSQPFVEFGDAAPVTEPFLVGSALGIASLLAILGVPIWMMITAVIHTQNIQGALTQLRLARQDGLVQDGPEVLFWQILLSPGLLLVAGLQALLITVLVMSTIALGVAVWRWLDRGVERGASRRARRHYDALDGDVVVRADAWTHDLPEPADPSAPMPTDVPAPPRDVP